MHPPPMLEVPPGMKILITKSLYGLKQSPLMWYQEMTRTLLSLGLKESHNDECLFFGTVNGKKVILVLYVDDMLVAGEDTAASDLLAAISKVYKITIEDKPTKFLGIHLEQRPDGFLLNLGTYIDSVCKE